jgi:hypothetical protein
MTRANRSVQFQGATHFELDLENKAENDVRAYLDQQIRSAQQFRSAQQYATYLQSSWSTVVLAALGSELYGVLGMTAKLAAETVSDLGVSLAAIRQTAISRLAGWA